MAFWGVELKPGKPYIHRSDNEGGRLHVSQATLGTVSSTETGKSIVQCNVGDKKSINLCSLFPERLENCALNLEFEEDDEVTFSIVGPNSVHLSGFFYGDDEDQDNLGDDYGSDDPYEEDIMGIDSEDEDDSIDYDSVDEDEEDYTDDDSVYPPPVRNSGVRIEEIVDEDKPTDENAMSKRAKKKKTQSNDSDNSNRQIVPKAGTGVPVIESEDEDGFPVSANGNKSDISKSEAALEEPKNKKTSDKTKKKSEKTDAAPGKNLKRKSDVSLDEIPARETTEPHGSSAQPDTLTPEYEVKQKKNKKRVVGEKVESSLENGMPDSNSKKESPVAEIGNDPPSAKKERKKKKKKNKQQENAQTPNAEGKQTDDTESVMEKQEKREAKSLQVRTFPNGLVIEELAMGKPDGKRASPGKKVSVHYIGKLKKNGKFFDSNIGSAPFKFRLGIGQVIKGWDVGVNGMRVGDKRRLTIPPAMGYGAKGVGAIPPNAWLVFDVELVDVN
ncbi:hypothetical protein ACS0TY_001326 [Phlomoides rotata]